MSERIDRRDDERLYQPAIHSDRIKILHLIKERTGIPMTVHVDRAIGEYVANYKTGELEFIESEPWEELQEYIELLNQKDREEYERSNSQG